MKGGVRSLRAMPVTTYRAATVERRKPALLKVCRACEPLREPCSIGRLAAHAVLSRGIATLAPAIRKALQHGQPKRIHLAPLLHHSPGLGIVEITPQPAHGAYSEIKPEATTVGERRRHRLRPQSRRVERGDAVWRSCHCSNLLECFLVRVGVRVERCGTSPLRPEQAERLQRTLAEHRREQNVQRVVGIERSPSDEAALSRPAIEGTHVDRHVDQVHGLIRCPQA